MFLINTDQMQEFEITMIIGCGDRTKINTNIHGKK